MHRSRAVNRIEKKNDFKEFIYKISKVVEIRDFCQNILENVMHHDSTVAGY